MAAVAARCAVCGARGDVLKKCGKCQLVFYCSREHQKLDYKFHKTSCKSPLPVMAAVAARCAVCGARGDVLKKCGKCQLVFYCSREHQKLDYKFHKTSCKSPLPVMAAVAARCAVCGARGDVLKKCGKCQLVFYCSREHQKSDYKFHKTSCKSPLVEDLTAVDPLNVLRHEELLQICSYLRSTDLFALHQVSPAWRKVVSDKRAWCNASLRLSNHPSCLGVLRIAPYLRCVTLPRDLPRRLRAALLDTAAEVAGLRWEYRAAPKEVRDLVKRFAAHLTALHLGPVDCHAVHLVAAVPLQPLRSLSIKTVTRGNHDNFTEVDDNGKTVRQYFSWLANDPKDCDDSCWNPKPLVHLLENHCKSLEEVELEKLATWQRKTNEVTRALARCVSLRRAVLPCSSGLPLLAEHPSLRSLTVLMRCHLGKADKDYLGHGGTDDLGPEHDDCLSALPASLESLTVEAHYSTLDGEVEALVRQAPRLTALRSITLRWRHYVAPGGPRRLSALELDPRPRLAAAFPAARLTWDMRVVTDYDKMITDMTEFDNGILP
ncbi:uncharacterized protein LOC117645168 [Thrips palmi]|uniref:Uncharacterized protein LOC117645168 n=1 Tax=Thrips palmi TaxID=161013 RepID=A0A6P8Z397_THRPL|nr:uncharacterized protein LOC117645168 [Thrips palmi]